jgi:hypothetical protein
MTYGRKICNTLKEIRQQIADKNEVEYNSTECHFEGECKGTCPKCESEVKYLETELHKRTQLGKAVAVAGIALGIASISSSCKSTYRTPGPIGCPRFFYEDKNDFFFDDYFIKQSTFQIEESGENTNK